MTQTKLFSFKLPTDLVEAVKTKAGKTSTTDVVIVALSDWLAPSPSSIDDSEALRSENARLRAERDQWRQRAQAIVSAATPAKRTDAVATKQISAHPSGPVYEPRLTVQGTAKPMFRKGSEADKAMKS